jgi:carbon-monoxide dehydrogenase medium subunit
MHEFDYFAPRTLADAAALASEGGVCRFLAGGTDLVLALERARDPVRRVIDLKGILELGGITRLKDGGYRMGALTTMSAILRDQELCAVYPALARAAAVVGGPAIRNRATLGGNLCNASPAADTATPLLAYGARVEVQSPAGKRELALADLWAGPRKTALKPQELVAAILLPALPPRSGSSFQRITRTAMDIALVNAAATVSLDGDGRLKSVVLTLGAVAPTVIRVDAIDTATRGQELSDGLLENAATLAREAARPIDDVRASAEYRRDMAGVLAGRAVRDAAEAAQLGNRGP